MLACKVNGPVMFSKRYINQKLVFSSLIPELIGQAVYLAKYTDFHCSSQSKDVQ